MLLPLRLSLESLPRFPDELLRLGQASVLGLLREGSEGLGAAGAASTPRPFPPTRPSFGLRHPLGRLPQHHFHLLLCLFEESPRTEVRRRKQIFRDALEQGSLALVDRQPFRILVREGLGPRLPLGGGGSGGGRGRGGSFAGLRQPILRRVDLFLDLRSALVVAVLDRSRLVLPQRLELVLNLPLDLTGLVLQEVLHRLLLRRQGSLERLQFPIGGLQLLRQLPIVRVDDGEDLFAPPNVLVSVSPLLRVAPPLLLRSPSHPLRLCFQFDAICVHFNFIAHCSLLR